MDEDCKDSGELTVYRLVFTVRLIQIINFFVMATIRRFEDLEIWQLARELAKNIFKITEQSGFLHEFKLKEQVKGSSGSIMDNIAEGFGRGSRLEFVQFLSIAKGSADELKSQLHRVSDYNLITEEVFKTHYEQADIVGAKIYSFMDYLNKTEHKGIKFKDRK